MKGRSRFQKPRERNAAAMEELETLAARGTAPPLAPPEASLVAALLGPLRGDPPDRSAAAEAALVILLITLAEKRPLNVIDKAPGDVAGASVRLEGDRTLSEHLSRWLGAKNIPVTQGALQSNTYRAGYRAGQAQTPALTDFVNWLSAPSRTIEQAQDLAAALVAGFLRNAIELPALPKLRRDGLTAVKFREVVESLFAAGSHGAFEQYLVAGLLRSEMAATGRTARAETKSVKVADRTSRAGGDVEIRQGQALVEALEVTAADWSAKLAQLAAGARKLDAVTVVAQGVQGTPANAFDQQLRKDPRLANVDVRFVELMGLVDFCSSRLDGAGRADALAFLYACLARWHRSEPALIMRLVNAVEEAGIVEGEAGSAEITPTEVDLEDEAELVLQRVHAHLRQGGSIGDERVAADLKRLLELASVVPPELDQPSQA